MNLGGTIYLNKKFCLLFFIVLVLYFYFVPFSEDHGTNFSRFPSQRVNLKSLLQMAIFTAEVGGKEVKENVNDNLIRIKENTIKGAKERVTTADYRSHCLMKQTIKKLYNRIKLVSEESKADCESYKFSSVSTELPLQVYALNDSWVKESDVTVWIDPLDATQEYTEKMYDYVTTMVCIAVQGKPIIGVVYKPFTQETFWAWVGVSKSPNLKTTIKDDNEVVFIVSRSHQGEVLKLIDSKLKSIKKTVKVAAGAGYKVVELINGNADVYLHTSAIKKWDICAGNALLFSVGGNMTTLKSESINYSDTDNVVNMDGLIATVKNQYHFNNLFN